MNRFMLISCNTPAHLLEPIKEYILNNQRVNFTPFEPSLSRDLVNVDMTEFKELMRLGEQYHEEHLVEPPHYEYTIANPGPVYEALTPAPPANTPIDTTDQYTTLKSVLGSDFQPDSTLESINLNSTAEPVSKKSRKRKIEHKGKPAIQKMREVYEEQLQDEISDERSPVDNLSLFRSVIIAVARETKILTLSKHSQTVYNDDTIFNEKFTKYVQSQYSEIRKTDKYEILKEAAKLSKAKLPRMQTFIKSGVNPDAEVEKAVALLKEQGINFVYPRICRLDRVYQAVKEMTNSLKIPKHLPVYNIHEYGHMIQAWMDEKYPSRFYLVVYRHDGTEEYCSMFDYENRTPIKLYSDEDMCYNIFDV